MACDSILDDLTVVPANEASFEDLQAIFGERGSAATWTGSGIRDHGE